MSPHRLYQHRWKENLRFQYQVWKSVVDWTIALYILIPALLIFFKTYIGWWNSEPDWFANVSLPIFVGFTYIFVGGAIPLYIKPADQLFLFQKKEWMQSYIQIGLHYAWWKQGVQSLLFTLLLWPLFNYIVDMDLFLFIGFWIYLWQAKMFGSLIQRRITILNRWIYKILWGVSLRVLGGCAFILIGVQGIKSPSVFVLASLIVGGCSVALAGRIKQTNTFLKDIEYDEIQRLKWVSLILGQTGYASPKYWVKKSPWIFPQSNTLFRERSSSHVMAESIMVLFEKWSSTVVIQSIYHIVYNRYYDFPDLVKVDIVVFSFDTVYTLGANVLPGIYEESSVSCVDSFDFSGQTYF